MNPKTVIRYSWIYNRIFNPKITKEEFFQLKKDCEEFKKLYEKYINEILVSIEKIHSKKWKYKFIPIYIVKEAPNSFSDPLTIKYREDPKYLLVVLAHELLHNNIVGKKFSNPKVLHGYMEPFFNKIIQNISIDLNKELQFFNKKIHKHYKIK